MSAGELEALQALRILLFLGGIFVFIVLFIDLMGDGPKVAHPKLRPIVPPDEECKLHARKLSECKRLGYHDDEKGDS